MSRAAWLLSIVITGAGGGILLGGCDSSSPSQPTPDGPPGDTGGTTDDMQSTCLPQGVMGQFLRRAGNPRLLPGAVFSDGNLSVAIEDPDVRWDAAAARYELHYGAPHAAAFGAAPAPMIRRATSPDRMAWTVADEPVLRASAAQGAWDAGHVGAPSVAYNPAAPADRRYLLLYAGGPAASPLPGPGGAGHSIGAAFSADGLSFARVPAAASPHGKEGLVLTGAQVYPATAAGGAAMVSDPEVAVIGGVYHAWFSSVACSTAACTAVTDRGVAHAHSTDGITWIVDEAPVRSLLRASADRTTGGRKPSVVHDEPRCRYELWLENDLPADASGQPVALDNSMGIYRAESLDGRAWSLRYDRPRDHLWSAAEPGEGLGLHAGMDVAQNGTGRLLLYVGYAAEDAPAGATLPDRATGAPLTGATVLSVATRDLP